MAAEEGVLRLWAGATMTCSRAVLMTIGQVAFYDEIKLILLSTPYFSDNVVTHVTSSLSAVSGLILNLMFTLFLTKTGTQIQLILFFLQGRYINGMSC